MKTDTFWQAEYVAANLRMIKCKDVMLHQIKHPKISQNVCDFLIDKTQN